MINMKQEFSQSDIESFEPTEKIGLIASINPEGLPHLSLITSLQAISPTEMVMGEFSAGLSKKFIQQNNTVAFLIMTLDRCLWRGRARWTRLEKKGPHYEMMNNKPMFRYNTYFGINTVHYFDLIETTERQPLAMGKIVTASLKTKLARGGAATGRKDPILRPLGTYIFNKLDSLKFLAYIDSNGVPVIVPVIQCQAADTGRLVFSTGIFQDELTAVPAGSTVAVYGMTMQMETILVRGAYIGTRRIRGIRCGEVDINWVYNSMPPAHGQIYPEVELKPVASF